MFNEGLKTHSLLPLLLIKRFLIGIIDIAGELRSIIPQLAVVNTFKSLPGVLASLQCCITCLVCHLLLVNSILICFAVCPLSSLVALLCIFDSTILS